MTERMQFFSRAWQAGDLTDNEAEAVSERYYRQHLPAIAARLPPALRELAEHRAASGEILSIHDALIRRSVVNRIRGELRLELRAGDLQVGYYDLDLIYDGVDFARSDWAVLRRTGSGERVELLYHEIDLTPDGRFVHRILCWPHGELEVVFGAFRWERVSRPDRQFGQPLESYVEIPATAG